MENGGLTWASDWLFVPLNMIVGRQGLVSFCLVYPLHCLLALIRFAVCSRCHQSN